MADISGEKPAEALPAIPRQIRESDTYAEQFAQLEINPSALDERLEPLLWEISRIPELFTRAYGTELSVVDLDGDPPLQLFFTYDDQFVDLLGIERRDR